ncbi:MAG: hypothetical protein SFY66_16120 [Oculatellaceae cyanobacterium bins.114]|nr:hypothetical protein [Oculatellaceae cyanobacterium bins.114]
MIQQCLKAILPIALFAQVPNTVLKWRSLRDVQLRGLDLRLLVQHPQSSLIGVTASEDLEKVAHGVSLL